MKTRKIIFDMPENWKMAGDCCPFNCNGNCASTKCPLANAREARQYDISCKTTWDGKSVTLWAVEDK